MESVLESKSTAVSLSVGLAQSQLWTHGQRLHMASHQTRGTRAHALASQVESFLLKRLRAISSLSLPTDGSSAAATYAAARPVMGCSAPDDVADVTPSQSALRT